MTVQFTAAPDLDDGPFAYLWDFGDGEEGAGPQVRHTFTKAGAHTVRLRVFEGEALVASATRQIDVRPGPPVRLRIDGRPVFTGDRTTLTLRAEDAHGNPVPLEEAEWFASTGRVSGDTKQASYTAGREPGIARVTVEARAGDSALRETVGVEVGQGYCETERRGAEWDVRWWLGEGGPALRDTLPGAFVLPGAPGDAPDATGMSASTAIVARRQGPVRFAIGGSGNVRLTVDGAIVLQAAGQALVDLEPGVHRLELEYTPAGRPDLWFEADGDVLEWQAVSQCHGRYVAQPGERYVLWETDASLEDVADMFGVPGESVITTLGVSGERALLVPGRPAPHAKVVLLHGLGSYAGCAPDDLTHQRGRGIAYAVQADAWQRTGEVPAIDGTDFVTFSYSNTYIDCETGRAYDGPESALPGARAAYGADDTCIGVEEAARRLARLVRTLLAEGPEARVYLVGHSMGGMVAAYYLASGMEGSEAVEALVTLDSPLRGYRGPELGLPCRYDSPSRRDLRGASSAAEVIATLGQSALGTRLLAINSTFVGHSLGANVVTVTCEAPELPVAEEDDLLTWLLGDIMNGVVSWQHGHVCGFTHPTSLRAIGEVVNGTPPAVVTSLKP